MRVNPSVYLTARSSKHIWNLFTSRNSQGYQPVEGHVLSPSLTTSASVLPLPTVNTDSRSKLFKSWIRSRHSVLPQIHQDITQRRRSSSHNGYTVWYDSPPSGSLVSPPTPLSFAHFALTDSLDHPQTPQTHAHSRNAHRSQTERLFPQMSRAQFPPFLPTSDCMLPRQCGVPCPPCIN